MEAICSSETSVNFRPTTWRYILEDSTLHNHCCEDLKSYTNYNLFQVCGILYIDICQKFLIQSNTRCLRKNDHILKMIIVKKSVKPQESSFHLMGEKLLKFHLCYVVCTRLIWLRIGISGGLL
jgi:hypothetical protein